MSVWILINLHHYSINIWFIMLPTIWLGTVKIPSNYPWTNFLSVSKFSSFNVQFKSKLILRFAGLRLIKHYHFTSKDKTSNVLLKIMSILETAKWNHASNIFTAKIFSLLLSRCKYLHVFISPPLFVAISAQMSPEDVHNHCYRGKCTESGRFYYQNMCE